MPSTCAKDGCGTRPCYGANAEARRPNCCAKHAPKGWVRLRGKNNRLCANPDCPKISSFGVAGSNFKEFCATHATAGMVDVRGRKCKHEGCRTRPTYGVPGTKKAEFCSKHVRAGMVNVITRRCLQPQYNITPSYGLQGSNSAKFCAQHAMDGMVNLRSKTCAHPGCKVTASFGEKGSQARRFCAEHASDGMTNKILSPSFRRRREPAAPPVVENAVDSIKLLSTTDDNTEVNKEKATEGASSVTSISTSATHAQDVAGDEGGETTESEMEEGEEENGNSPQAFAYDTSTDEQCSSRPVEVRRGAAVGGGKGNISGDGCPPNPNARANARSLASSSTGARTNDGRLASGRSATSGPDSSFELSSGGDRKQPESPASQGVR